jgi:hypothetical protein
MAGRLPSNCYWAQVNWTAHSDRKARVAVRFCIYRAGPPLLAGAAAVKRKTHRMYLHTPIEDHSVYN